MKICFQLQRQFAYVGHSMAVALKKNYGITDFCAYVELTSSLNFLTSQTEVPYSGFLFEGDLHSGYKTEKLDVEYLKELEREYGLPNLWPYIEVDRTVRYGLYLHSYPYDTPLLTHEEMMRTIQSSTKQILAFLEKEKPDCIIFSVVTDVSSLLLYHIAKKKNIRVLLIQTARVGNKHSLTEKYGTLSYVTDLLALLQGKKISLPQERLLAEEFLKKFREKPVPHSLIDAPGARPINRKLQFGFLLPSKIWSSLYWFVKNGVDYFRYKDREYIKSPWHFLVDRIRQKIRVLRGFEDLYDEVTPEEPFAFYPLHFEPEIALSLFAPFYNNQLWLAKQIGRSLPMNYKLYIKEHPAMFGNRPRRFYTELKKIPNVKLIKPSVISFEILRRAKIVITITGTPGWEAMLLQKPVITFGDTFYNALEVVKKCTAIAELPFIIKEQLEHFAYDEPALINMLTAIYKEGADLDLNQLWVIEGSWNLEKKKKGVVSFVDYLAQKLDLEPVHNLSL